MERMKWIGVMSIQLDFAKFSASYWQGCQVVGLRSGYLWPQNGLKVLPPNWCGRHHIAKAQAGSLRRLGLDDTVLPITRCQRFTQADLNYDQPDNRQTEDDGPNSRDAAREGVCFHASTLVHHAPRVLIERIY